MNNRIIVVDDEASELQTLRFILEKENFLVSTFERGIPALEAVEDINPGLIILDLKLPDIDGIEVCKKLKHKESTKDIPIIMVTGRSTDEEEGLKMGADSYLLKPYTPEDLLERVRSVIVSSNH